MSVIAWDGKTLAADKRASLGTGIFTTTKIFSVNGDLVGYTGDADGGQEMVEWYRDGAHPSHFPSSQRDKEGWSGLLVIKPGGEILKYERTPYPIPYGKQNFAVGCGRDFAMMAMHLGKTATEAVELTCLFDSGCGNGVDKLTHS